MSEPAGPEGPEGPDRCQCRCELWAHALYRVCDPTCAQAIVHAQFETPAGIEWRYLCIPCWDHVRYARQAGGERVTTDLARMS